jgi:type I restriction enzyme S subunit
LRFPKFQGEWEESELGRISLISKGAGISKDQLSGDGELCILYGELYTKYKSEVINNVQSHTNTDASNLVRSEANDIIIPSSGETAIDISTARCVLFSNILLGGDLNIVRLHNKGDGRFFSYQLNGKRKYDIAKIAQGVSVVHLYGGNLKRLKVFYPKRDEQQKISTFLTFIDQRIQTQNKIIEDLKLQKESLVEHLFRQKHPTRFPGFFDKWNLLTYNELFDISTTKNTDNTIDNVLSASQIYGMIDRNEIDINIKFDEKSIKSYKIVEPGDYVIHLRSFQGGFAFSDKKGICSPAYTILRPKELLKYGFLKEFFMSKRFIELLKLVTYGIRDGRSISAGEFLKLKIYLPSRQEQSKIMAILSVINDKIDCESNLYDLLVKQKNYLLQNLFV